MDGILLATPHQLPDEYSLKSGFFDDRPIILVDRGINQRDNGRLIVKEYEGAYQAVSYLINNGHQNIGMLKRKYWLLSIGRTFQWLSSCVERSSDPV